MTSDGSFDLAAFDGLVEAQEAGIEVEILDPSGKPIGADGFRVRIAGVDSKRFRSIRRDLAQEAISRERLDDLSSDEQEANHLRVLARCTMSWSPVRLDGAELECTEANAIRLYQRFPFIRDQVEAKAGRRSAFMQRSAIASSERSETSTTESAQGSQ